MDSQNKVMIISLDGATFDVINPLVQQGYMPNVGAMMSKGVSAELESVMPPVTAPAWTSFMTGKNPNKHGILDFSQFHETSYSWSINNAQSIRSKTIWQILSDKGKRIVVMNLPYLYPPYKVNGVMVSGWDSPFLDETFSYPPDVSADILRRFPDYASNLWISELKPLQSDAHFSEFTQKLKLGFEQQMQIALDLLSKESWDVFMVHFHQTDWMQHKLWDYIEQACSDSADHSPKIEATRDCYREYDRGVGILLKAVEHLRPTNIVLSDHGFGRFLGSIYPNFFLKEWGYLSVKEQSQDQLKSVKDLFRKSKHESVRKLYRTVSKAKNSLGANDDTQHDTWADSTGDVLSRRGSNWDWSRTKAAAVYAYQVAFVWLNVEDRGPQGIVRSGDEYEKLLVDLISRFRELRHPHTSQQLITDVVRGVDLYPPSSESVSIPDLVLIPVDGYGFSFSIADVVPEVSPEGSHRHNGVLIIHGGLVRRPETELRPELIDLAPTIFHVLGLPVPSDMDGRVLEEILTLKQQVRFEDIDNGLAPAGHEYNQEESEIVTQRLRSLGYIE